MSSFFDFFKKQVDKTTALPKLEQWFDSQRGKAMLECQQTIVDEVLSSQFGYYLLQLSVDSRIQLYNNSRVQNKYRCHPLAITADVHCDCQQLPFANESIDVIVLHHCQEFVTNPHQLLREIHRVMVPHGQLVIIGFNPWSLLGLYSQIGRFIATSAWQNQMISSRRMKDWLELLGFNSDSCQFGFHLPQLLEQTKKPAMKTFLRHWPLGSFYLISAIKEEAGMTPLRPAWKYSKSAFSGLSPIKPSGRIHHNKRKSKDHIEEVA